MMVAETVMTKMKPFPGPSFSLSKLVFASGPKTSSEPLFAHSSNAMNAAWAASNVLRPAVV